MLDFGRQSRIAGSTRGVAGETVLQAGTKGKGAVIWRPSNHAGGLQQQVSACVHSVDSQPNPVAQLMGRVRDTGPNSLLEWQQMTMQRMAVRVRAAGNGDAENGNTQRVQASRQTLTSSVLSPKGMLTSGSSSQCPAPSSALGKLVSQSLDSSPLSSTVIDHCELWSNGFENTELLENDPGDSDFNFGTSPSTDRSPLRKDLREPRRLLFAPPLPLHDFSKDKNDPLPQTGHLALLPAPRLPQVCDVSSEILVELLPDEHAALIDERKQSFVDWHATGCTSELVFNAKQVDCRAIREASAAEAENQLLGGGKPGGIETYRENAAEIHMEDETKRALRSANMVRFMDPFYLLQDQNDKTLLFESRFECGNLCKAYRVGDNEYDLELSPDIKTRGHTQWFYFSVRNTRKGSPYIINITNFCKRGSLYSSGLRPLMFSEKRAKDKGLGWSRCGSKICYFQNSKCLAGEDHKEQKAQARQRDENKFTLSFEVEFPCDYDTVYLAHCFPFSFRDHQEHLDRLEKEPKRRKFIRRRVLAKTIANNDCDVITITSPAGSYEDQQARPIIVMSSRVHPGETNASWMMKGILDFLTDPSDPIAAHLRNSCEFRIVPMLNPDGVINGNYRCNLAGCDLNRHYKRPNPQQHPTIHAHKNMIQQLCKDRRVLLSLDLHGHSCKRNIFIYGCHAKYWSTVDGGNETAPLPFLEQVYPYLLAQQNDSFSFQDSTFKVQRCKASTGRVVCWRECKIVNSYTLEASFCGADQGGNKGLHFTSADLEKMGQSICKGLWSYLQLCDDEASLGAIVSKISKFCAGADGDLTQTDDIDAMDSSSGEEREDVTELVRAGVRKLRKCKKTRRPEDSSERMAVMIDDPYRPRARPKETVEMMVERLARPKRVSDRSSAPNVPFRPPANEIKVGSLQPKSMDQKQMQMRETETPLGLSSRFAKSSGRSAVLDKLATQHAVVVRHPFRGADKLKECDKRGISEEPSEIKTKEEEPFVFARCQSLQDLDSRHSMRSPAAEQITDRQNDRQEAQLESRMPFHARCKYMSTSPISASRPADGISQQRTLFRSASIGSSGNGDLSSYHRMTDCVGTSCVEPSSHSDYRRTQRWFPSTPFPRPAAEGGGWEKRGDAPERKDESPLLRRRRTYLRHTEGDGGRKRK